MFKCSLLYCMVLTFWALITFYTLDKLHLFTMKEMVGAGMRTPNNMVNGELERFSIYINAEFRCVCYRQKWTRINIHRLPIKAHTILSHLDERGKTNWVSSMLPFKAHRILCNLDETGETNWTSSMLPFEAYRILSNLDETGETNWASSMLPFKAHRILCNLDERGETNWASGILPFKAHRILCNLDKKRWNRLGV